MKSMVLILFAEKNVRIFGNAMQKLHIFGKKSGSFAPDMFELTIDVVSNRSISIIVINFFV